MPVIALLAAVLAVSAEQLVQWKYGTLGIVGLTLLTVGVKARNATCSSLGAAVLALMVTGPVL
ncbi:hypothetical protein [Streptomyces sp. CC224B]|uniref:hypothetical protein n=1 Tax=Streptomyces sp. CC224B TaxID=3044571 RepID=UPI0024A9B7BD|nr:hypothetical protein [Streptomyces sp. CC224B]